eukprot:351779-Chlamydomonas_euryale.AAC.4
MLTISDYARCRWPTYATGPEGHGGLRLAGWVDALNDGVAWPADARRRMARTLGRSAGGDGKEGGGAVEGSGGGEEVCGGGSSRGRLADDTERPAGAWRRHGDDGAHEVGGSGEDDGSLDVISVSHFVPDVRLCPEKRFLTFPNLVSHVGHYGPGRGAGAGRREAGKRW